MTSEAKGQHDVPLLDEVTSLLEKERTLMGLKVLEQQVEAQDWKRKYEALVGQVASAGGTSDAAHVFEMAADIAAKPLKIDNFRMKIMETIRADGMNWVVDLSNINVGTEGVVEVLKIFHGMRDSCRVTTILLRNSQLDAGCNEHMAAVISFPYFEGIDASWNSLTKPFYQSMIKALEVRRRPPQYLLLNNNPGLAGLSFTKMLQVLSQETWGIMVSVKDATSSPAEQGKKSKTAMCAADFLKVLNTQLVGNNKKKTSSAAVVGKQKSGIQLLTVLGLVNSTLSRISLKLLEDTLELATATLTDLDLSFSFIGYRGMEAIKNAMSRPERSQIVRLGLKGNAFTNSMVPLLGSVVRHSTTLTFLDISHNQITGGGLLDLTEHMRHNFILSVLCITGNPIGQNSATMSQDELTKFGCPVHIRWNGILSAPGSTNSNVGRDKGSFIFSRLKRESTLVQPTGQDAVMYAVPVGCIQLKKSLIFPKDSGERSALKAEQRKSKMLIEWNMQPRYEDATRLADLDRLNHRRHVNNVFLPMEWEIYVVTPQGRTSLTHQRLRGGSGLPPGDTWIQCRAVVEAMPAHGQLEIVVRAIRDHRVPVDSGNPAYTTQADIRSKTFADILSKSTQFRSSNVSTLPSIQVDSYGLNFSVYDDVSTDYATFGGDIPEWSGTMNQIVSLRTSSLITMPSFNPAYEIPSSSACAYSAGATMKQMAGFPPAGHDVLRLFQWHGPMTPTAVVEFETKLSSRQQVSNEGVEADWDVSLEGRGGGVSQMSYECSVHICFAHGQFETIGSCSLLPSGKCVGSENFFIPAIESIAGTGAILATWLWHHWRVSLPILRPCDRVILTGRAIKSSTLEHSFSSTGGGAADKCFIHCRDARIAIPFDSFEEREELVGSQTSLLFAVHNDPSLFPC